MSNIFADLELPVNVAIDFDLVPAPLADKSARHIEEAYLAREVSRALQAWYYETYA